ncbi:MAG: SIMPL domain-containing protein [Candidatus Nanoarchaeia archaeon]|nr:SIMPL domain-containing protein [Candidatus Nanoarchaeia archaeon]
MDKNALIAVLVIAGVVLALGITFFDRTLPDIGKTISANGVATLKTMPDQASVNVRIDSLQPTAEAAKNKNAEITDKVEKALKNIVDEKDIQTEYFNIYEEFDWTDGNQKSKGWRASHTLKIIATDFEDIGKIVDAAVNGGATGIDYINFEISEARKSELKKQVLEMASKDAREKAQAIASGLNAKIGDIVSVTTSDYDYMPIPIYRADAGMALEKAVTDISPKELEVSANVQVTFELE